MVIEDFWVDGLASRAIAGKKRERERERRQTELSYISFAFNLRRIQSEFLPFFEALTFSPTDDTGSIGHCNISILIRRGSLCKRGTDSRWLLLCQQLVHRRFVKGERSDWAMIGVEDGAGKTRRSRMNRGLGVGMC